MNLLKITIVFLLTSLVIVSCSLNKTGVSTQRPFVDIDWEDMEYVRDVQDTTVQSYFLAFPVGGKRMKRGYITTNVLNLNGIFSNKRGMRNALYNILQEVPDADFVLPVYQSVHIDRMFLGRREYIALRVKAFRIKTRMPGDTLNSGN